MKAKKLLGVVVLVIGLISIPFGLSRVLADDSVITTLEAESMTLPRNGASIVADASASGGQVAKLTINGNLNTNFNLPSNSVRFTVRAKGDFCNNNWARFTVSVDGTSMGVNSRLTNSMTEYQINVPISAGPHLIRLVVSDTYSGGGCTRAAYFDKVTFYGLDLPTPPTLNLTATSTDLAYNTGTTLNWTSTNTTACTATDSWSGSRPTSGSYSTGNLTASQNYSLTCIGPAGNVTQTIAVTVAPPPPPTVNFSATPSSVLVNQSSTLNWSTTNADSCDATGAWSGSKALAGSESTGALNDNQTYVLTCTGPGGQASQSVNVVVAPPPPPSAPTVNFNANPPIVLVGQSSTLNWTTTDADACEASGAWTGNKPLDGTESTGNLSTAQGYSYVLTCTGEGGMTSIAVVVTAEEPLVATCTVSDTSGCVPGHTLSFTNEVWSCNQPLSNYGPLPLKVITSFTPDHLVNDIGVDLTTGCAGDGDPDTVDLILDVRGDGITHGPNNDAVKIRLAAGYNAGIQITGHADCGPRFGSDNHQDGIQAQGGRDITFVDFSIGDYDNGLSTCQGAGGAMFYSGVSSYDAKNMQVIRGKYIACVRGLSSGDTGNSGIVDGALFRSGRSDGTDPKCVGFNSPKPCNSSLNVVWTNISCQKWNSSLDIWQNRL